MSAKKETAVDFYALAVSRLQIAIEGKKISLGEYSVSLHDVFKQAKQLEKEQMEEVYGKVKLQSGKILEFEKYYSQTFGTNSDGDK